MKAVLEVLRGWLLINLNAHEKTFRLIKPGLAPAMAVTSGYLQSTLAMALISAAATTVAMVSVISSSLLIAVGATLTLMALAGLIIVPRLPERQDNTWLRWPAVATFVFTGALALLAFAPLTPAITAVIVIAAVSTGFAVVMSFLIKETLAVAWLGVLLYKGVAFDTQVEAVKLTWQALTGVVKWAASTGLGLVRLAAAAIPGVNLDEVTAAAAAMPGLGADISANLTRSINQGLGRLLAQALGYTRAIGRFFIGLLVLQFAMFLINSLLRQWVESASDPLWVTLLMMLVVGMVFKSLPSSRTEVRWRLAPPVGQGFAPLASWITLTVILPVVLCWALGGAILRVPEVDAWRITCQAVTGHKVITTEWHRTLLLLDNQRQTGAPQRLIFPGTQPVYTTAAKYEATDSTVAFARPTTGQPWGKLRSGLYYQGQQFLVVEEMDSAGVKTGTIYAVAYDGQSESSWQTEPTLVFPYERRFREFRSQLLAADTP